MSKRYVYGLIIAFALFTSIGVWQVYRIGRLTETFEHEKLLTQAITFAKALPIDLCLRFTFTAEDKSQPAFQHLQEQLVLATEHMTLKGLYLLAQRDGEWVMGPSSYFKAQTSSPLPGSLYPQPPPEVFTAYKSRQPQTTRPRAKGYGSGISAFIPILNPKTGEVLFLVGADLDSQTLRLNFLYARVIPFFTTFILLALCLIGVKVFGKHNDLSASTHWRQKYSETILCAIALLTLTASITWYVRLTEEHARALTFISQAQPQVEDIAKEMSTLYGKLDGLTRLFGASSHVTEKDFKCFVSRFTESVNVHSVLWLPAVQAEDIARFEVKARHSGLASYRVWQQDAHGNPVAATGRKTVYPAYYLAAADDL